MIQFAYAADGTTAAGAGNMTSTIIMIVVMIAIFYFLLIRPENKRKKQAEEMRNSLKKGDWLTTIGGIYGRVVAITDSTLAPLYPLASAALLVRSDMISFVDSITAPLSLLNALIVTVGQRKNEEVPETFSELERVWSQYSVFGKTEDE